MIIAGAGIRPRARDVRRARQRRSKSAGPSMPVVVLGLSRRRTPATSSWSSRTSARRARWPNSGRASARGEARTTAGRQARGHVQPDGRRRELDDRSSSSRPTCRAARRRCATRWSKLSNDEVKVNVSRARASAASRRSDVNLAAASNAVDHRLQRACRRCRPQRRSRRSGVDVRYYSIIYEAIDDVKAGPVRHAGAGDPRADRRHWPRCEEVFRSPQVRRRRRLHGHRGLRASRTTRSACCATTSSSIEGELESLRRFKDDVNEVRAGTECGIGVKNYNDVQVGDHIECYERVEVARTLD